MVDQDIEGAIVQYKIRVYMDEVRQINQAELERKLCATGALSVDIQPQKIQRETVRCERLLRIERLPDKVREMAEIKGQTLTDGILVKAELLETESPESIVETVYRNLPEIPATSFSTVGDEQAAGRAERRMAS